MAQEKPPSLKELDAKLEAAQARRQGRKGTQDGPRRGSGLSLALRIGTELVAALIVGVGIGILLDRWLETSPWFMLLFFVLGSAAGIMNVFRAMKGYDSSVGFARPKKKENGQDR
jgi:ATP synthase protein I